MKRYHRMVPVLSLMLTSASLSACGQSKTSATLPMPDTARVAETNLLPLPTVPDSIFDPQERADYVVLHYWDPLPPTDPRVTDSAFMDANFARYAEQFNFASEGGAAYAVGILADQASEAPEHLKMLGDLAIKYFGRRGATTFSDRSLIIWMRELTENGSLGEALRSKYGFMLEAASKNTPGTDAADIRFTRRGGETATLRGLPAAPYTLLVLYDPDCDTCHETIERVMADKRLARPVDAGQVRVVLIDVADDRSTFEYDPTKYPARWIVGYDESRVADNDIYIFDRTPAIYLLDRNYKVILKDATVDELMEYARTVAG